MDLEDWPTERFEENRSHLRAVAYRMLGSLDEADDAVQEAWLRLSRADTSRVDNLRGWLTTVVARVCLDMLRSRKSRREEPLGAELPEPVPGPEHEVMLADSVGLALLVVLETLTPAERVAFVLHDLFDLPFDEIAPIVGRTPAAARQLASRGRRRVHGGTAVSGGNHTRQREVVDAFLAASRGVNWTPCWRCSIRTSCCAQTVPPCGSGRRARSAERRPWPPPSSGGPKARNRLSSTAPPDSFGLRAEGRASCSPSRSKAEGSPRSI